jgi:branched-chain amino acid transport system substrate-binding protein
MAVNELNKAGGIEVDGRKYDFTLVKLDDMLDPTQAVMNARRLKEQYGAVAIFNPVTAMTLATMSINQEKGSEFLMMAYTSSPGIAKLNNKLTIVIPPTFSVYAQIFSQWAWDQGYRKAGIILTSENYGDEWTRFFKKFWETKGGEITSIKPANYYTQTDFSAHISAVLATDPDVMLIGGPSATTALVIEQTRNLGYKGGFVLIDQAKLDWIINLLGSTDLIQNAVGVGVVADLPTPITPYFNKTYAANYQGMVTWEACLHYGAVMALARAIDAADTADDIRAIRKAFPQAYPLLGDKVPAEVHGLTEDGRQQMLASVQTVDDGKLTSPVLYAWWPKTLEEFKAVENRAQSPGNLKWLQVSDY